MTLPGLLLAALVIALSPLVTHAQEPERESPPSPDADEAPVFEIDGSFDAGFRWRDIGGNEDRYRQHLNYGTGPRLFNLDLSMTPTNSGAVDLVNIYSSGLGDPYESIGLTVKKFDGFNFRFRRNTSAYFYRDMLVAPDQIDPDKSNGDFRHFDFDRTRDRIDFDMRVARRTKAFVRFNRQTRTGDSATVFDVSRDEFELDRPLSEIKNDYTVGFQTAFDKASFYVDQTYRDYESEGRIFLPGASVGENSENLTELFFYEQLLPFDFTMPQTTVKVNLRPTPRLTVTGGFVYSSLTADFSHSETARGISFSGQPFDTTVAGGGGLERQTILADIDLVYDLNERVAVIGGVRHGQFDQDGTLDQSFPDATQVDTGVDITTNILEVGAQVFPTRGVSVTGGLRFESRDTELLGAGAGLDMVDTQRTTFFVNGNARPSPMLSLLGEYERGTYDNPLTLIAPTTMDRVKARVRVQPAEGLTVTGVFFTRRIENDLARPTLGPTVSRSTLTGALSDASMLDTTDLTVHASYTRSATTVYGAFTRRDVSNRVLNLVDAEGVAFEHLALYESDLSRGSGGVRVELNDSVALGADVGAYRNRGTFGLNWQQYQVYGDLLSPAGYLLRLSYQYNSLNEQDFDFDDYSAHMVTVSVGYRF